MKGSMHLHVLQTMAHLLYLVQHSLQKGCVFHGRTQPLDCLDDNELIARYRLPRKCNHRTYQTNRQFDRHISLIVHKAMTRARLILKCFLSQDRQLLFKAYCVYV